MPKASKQLIDALNKDLEDELAAITQYMYHHVMGKGFDSEPITKMARKNAMDEMRHAEMLSERIDYLGGVPTPKPSHIDIGGELKQMVEQDLGKERGAIAQYKEHIKLAAAEGDHVTRLMLENILTDEENHAYGWETILGLES